MCGKKWILDDNQQRPAQWLDRKEAPKHFPNPNLLKKRSWSLFDGLLPIWSTTTFWISVKPLHLRSMLSKSMTCTKNCNACSRHWSTERAKFFSMTTPDLMSQNQCFKRWMNQAIKFCLITIFLTSHQLTTTSSSILTAFYRKNASTKSRRQKMLSKSLLNLEAWIFYTKRIKKLISHWQKCVDCNGSYFD